MRRQKRNEHPRSSPILDSSDASPVTPPPIEDQAAPRVSEEVFEGAGLVYGETQAPFEKLHNQLKEHDPVFFSGLEDNPYYPFSCKIEWEVVEWLSRSGMSRAHIDKFFKLEYV
jgi:hypothetical protein